VIPGLGPYISILVTVVNVVMTFPPIFLIEVNANHPSLFRRFTDALKLVAGWKEEAPYGLSIDCGGGARVHWLRVEQRIRSDVQRRDFGIHHVGLSVH
jgi:hypothetical protein